MTEPLQVGQFAIVDHEPVDRGPNAGVFLGKGPADDRAELYIVAEGTTPAGEAFAGHVISGAGNAWHHLDMSLTGALRRVFADAERSLRDWNRKSIAQQRVSIGLSGFGHRGSQAVLAQAGPSVAFHRSGSEVRVYYPDEAYGRPLGAGGEADPQLRRLDFAPGDRLLLLSTPAIRELDDELIGGILGLEGEKILAELYHRLQHLKNVTVLLVTRREAARGARPPLPPAEFREARPEYVIGAETVATPAQAGGDPFQPSLFLDDHDDGGIVAARRRLYEVSARTRYAAVAPEAAVAEIPAPLRRASGDNRLLTLAAERRARAAVAAATATAVSATAYGRRHAAVARGDDLAANDIRRRQQRRDSFSRGLVREETLGPPEPSSFDIPLAGEMADDLRSRGATATPVAETIITDNATALGTGGSLVKVRGSISGRWKGGGSLSRRRTAGGSQLPPTWLVIVVGLGVLLTIVGAVTVPGMVSGDGRRAYTVLIDQARWKIVNAEANPDASARRTELTDAEALLLEAKADPAAGPEVQGLLDDVAAALARMDAVREPALVETVPSLDQFGEKPVTASRLAAGPTQAYLLDTSSSQVISVALAGGERKVVFAENKDAGRGRPLALAYFDGTDFGGPYLLVIDAARALWGVTPAGEVRRVEFVAPASLAVTDIAVSGRELYVLDASASQVLRFVPAANGYTQAPQKVLETPDLAAARRIFAGREILTSDADGTIRWFGGQQSLVFSEAGINKKLITQQVPQPIGESGEVAVLDPANDRIVVFRSDGSFAYQYRSKDFAGATALRLMPDGTAYIYAGGALRRVRFQPQ